MQTKNLNQHKNVYNTQIDPLERGFLTPLILGYIAMRAITLLSAFLAGYYIQETKKWKESSSYWYRMYEGVKAK